MSIKLPRLCRRSSRSAASGKSRSQRDVFGLLRQHVLHRRALHQLLVWRAAAVAKRQVSAQQHQLGVALLVQQRVVDGGPQRLNLFSRQLQRQKHVVVCGHCQARRHVAGGARLGVGYADAEVCSEALHAVQRARSLARRVAPHEHAHDQRHPLGALGGVVAQRRQLAVNQRVHVAVLLGRRLHARGRTEGVCSFRQHIECEFRQQARLAHAVGEARDDGVVVFAAGDAGDAGVVDANRKRQQLLQSLPRDVCL
jgi:hypothetical protein